ncbi:hypothetical protein [Nonomuraea gerenzanensis]|uniref:Uncharacterized protein n=1 Tax=Nonomuraea gerenzanensis TaxID=93944 RepID=A0A1M4BKZ9_9ACTN|nr:hypothetical protein [Nonomuraea gerenzanensis]UBU10046.1 hypothetical protein LCN96_37595 [Nonomuraea gerenzanensis]SAP16330.1 hypothetical protein BN4615_P10993 [Nonomuraea gerenzanensis]
MTTHHTTTPNNELTGEPALLLGFVSSAVQVVAAFFLPWPDETVAIINAAIAAGFGVWVAVSTRAIDNGGSIKGAILGAAQALINLAMVFGWHLTDKQTSALILLVTMGCALFIRQTSKPKPEPGVHRTPTVTSL